MVVSPRITVTKTQYFPPNGLPLLLPIYTSVHGLSMDRSYIIFRVCKIAAPSSSLPPNDLPDSRPSPSADQADSNSVENPANNADCDQRLQSPRDIASNESDVQGFRRSRGRHKKGLKMEDHLKAWTQRKMESGVPESQCLLPFLVGSNKMVDCVVCHRCIYPGEEVLCSVRGCRGICHPLCAVEEKKISSQNSFKCPHHTCFLCKQKPEWRCTQCSIASHDKCAAWPDKVVRQENEPGRAICWRHPKSWRRANKHMVATSDIEEIFSRLPLPYVDEEFKIELSWRDPMENRARPPPYVHIKRNIYLAEMKRKVCDDDNGCVNCTSSCSGRCDCRDQCISCSKSCHCDSESCTNRPFRKERKIRVVKTELCGWGLEAAEPLNKGDFIIEYVGEVISDALCERRLWDMKRKGVQNFYLCAIRKDFTIDSTFKGNESRFFNHSCAPNCVLEKWQVDGKIRIGVFADKSIRVGEQLTYNYRFVQFGEEVKCHCGAPNCNGYLGAKRKAGKLDLLPRWGSKRKRSRVTRLPAVNVSAIWAS